MSQLDFNETSKRWQEYGERYLREGRSLMVVEIEKLLLSSIFLLGFIGTLIQISGLKNISESESECIILFFSLIFGFISVIFGLLAILSTNKFMNKVGRMYENMSNKLAQYMLDTGKAFGDRYPEYLWSDQKEKVDFFPWQFILQVSAFILGLLFLLLFIILKLKIF